MPLQFLSTRLTFNPVTHDVHLSALAGDDLAEVVVSRLVVEHLAGLPDLSKDDSLTTVVLHKKELEAAAAHAFEKNGMGAHTIIIKKPDLSAATASLQKPS